MVLLKKLQIWKKPWRRNVCRFSNSSVWIRLQGDLIKNYAKKKSYSTFGATSTERRLNLILKTRTSTHQKGLATMILTDKKSLENQQFNDILTLILRKGVLKDQPAQCISQNSSCQVWLCNFKTGQMFAVCDLAWLIQYEI